MKYIIALMLLTLSSFSSNATDLKGYEVTGVTGNKLTEGGLSNMKIDFNTCTATQNGKNTFTDFTLVICTPNMFMLIYKGNEDYSKSSTFTFLRSNGVVTQVMVRTGFGAYDGASLMTTAKHK